MRYILRMLPILLIIFSLFVGFPTPAEQKKPSPNSLKYSVVKLSFTNWYDEHRCGTAFVIAKDKFLTASHICEDLQYEDSKPIYIDYKSKKPVEHKLDFVELKFDLTGDLCVIRTADKLPLRPLPVAKVAPKVGDKIFIFGAPGCEYGVFKEGIYSGNMSFRVDWVMRYVYILSIECVKGNSGSPVLNKNGEVIGVINYLNRCIGICHSAQWEAVQNIIQNRK